MLLHDHLRRIYMLSALSDEQLMAVEQTTRQVQLDGGERLFSHGDPVAGFFFLLAGQIKLYRLSPEGYEKIIEIVRPGQTFAEAAMFMERRDGYPVNAEALEPSELLRFDAATIMGILKESNATCLRLMAAMSQRLRAQVNEIDQLTLHSATFRLVSYLLEEHAASRPASNEIQLTVPKSVLAARLGIQPETFSRILARLSGQGFIEVRRQSVVLNDIDKLRAEMLETH